MSRRFESCCKPWPVLLDTSLPAEIARVACATDHSPPEVLIRVVSAGSNTLHAIRQHIDYICKGERRRLENDDGEVMTGKRVAHRLIEQWDLDLEDLLWRQPYVMPERRTPPKLVHKLLFSMPAGTSPERLLAAVRGFAQEEFGFAHRYALALHTDEPHPHVHAVIKAMSEHGERLNIRKPTLRAWREAFARLLRAQGVAAKATPGGVAQRTRRPKLPGIYRLARH